VLAQLSLAVRHYAAACYQSKNAAYNESCSGNEHGESPVFAARLGDGATRIPYAHKYGTNDESAGGSDYADARSLHTKLHEF
jgi:hypothetical protein